MESEPVTLGDWYEILDPADFIEAATFANRGSKPAPWIANFLRNWAPEIINGRRRWEAAKNRKYVLERLAKTEATASELTELLHDSEVIKFLQLPPYGPFESELGVTILIGSLATRARNAVSSSNLSTGDGDGRSGPGKAIPPAVPNPKVLCASIIAELWNLFHGSYPRASKNALKAANSYWVASSGKLKGWGNDRDRSWLRYFQQIDDPSLWGLRTEMRRQLNS